MLRKVNSSIIVYLLGIFLLLIFSLCIRSLYFSGDILNYFPFFSSTDWQRPYNSLLADPIFQFQPWRVFAAEQLRSGVFPLWNSMNGLGVPFLANPQTALFFPLTIISYFLPVASGLFFVHAAKVFIYFFFTYKYLEAIHLGKRASFLGAMAASFSSFFMTWLLWPHTNVFLFLPILLLLIEKIAITKIKVYLYILFSLCTAAAFFGGHPETLVQIGIVVVGYAFFRLFRYRKRLLGILFFGLIGILLSSVQLLPFLEYLFFSHAWVGRTGFSSENPLPLLSVIQNLFPFLLGGPHKEFYRAFSGTNFQESTGGYVGVVFLVLGAYALLAERKKRLVLFWGVVCMLAFGMAYSLPVISLIHHLPILEKSANQRFLGIFGFSVIVLGSWMIDVVLKRKTRYTVKGLYVLGAVGLITSVSIFYLPEIIKFFGYFPPVGFEMQLQKHLLLQVASTLCFLAALFYGRNKIMSQFVLLLCFLFLQTGYLFLNYVPFLSKENYYPNTAMIRELEKLPEGSYLEIGNPSIKEESNIVYGLRSVENYDALSINTYKQSFDKAFPTKNHWDNAEAVNEDSLALFGVRYILSDYDLRLASDSIEIDTDRLLPLTRNDEYRFPFQPKRATISGIRILTANYNRENACSFTVTIVDAGSEIYKTTESCKNVRDKMFYFISIPEIPVDSGKSYEVRIQSNGDNVNAIALWGGEVPYLQLFYPHTGSEFLRLHTYKNNSFLFEYPRAKLIEFGGEYKVLERGHQKLLLETAHRTASEMQVKMPFYPGWKATVDGRNASLRSRDAFIELSVPAGRHRIKIYYGPESFLLGLAVSGIALLFLIVILIRSVLRERFVLRVFKSWTVFAKNSNDIVWWKHAAVLLSGILLSIVSYILIISYLQLQFVVPKSTAINWYTVNNYPRQQDYFYFYTSVFYTVVVTSLIWLVWLWKKYK